MERRENTGNRDALRRSMQTVTDCHTFVVRESCYRFYEPSYMEHSHGCSQEVQSFKRWSKARRIVRTQSRWCQEAVKRKKVRWRAQVIAQAEQQPEVIVPAQRRRPQVIAQIEQPFLRTQGRRSQEQRTQEWRTQEQRT
jgi:hypothetical protein